MADAHPNFDISLVTPDGAVFDGEAQMIVVPGAPVRSASSLGMPRS